ncbi:MAG: M15 family metallopeptidase [Ferruginibacter sp.]|nr:M15 family metallopeptidase [Ferruginibacter sp.]
MKKLRLFILLAFVLCIAKYCISQPLAVVTSAKAYKSSLLVGNNNVLIDVKNLIPSIILDLKYATQNNFTGINLYGNCTHTYMRTNPAHSLYKIQQFLKEKGLGLKIFDAYRPYSVTKKMWNLIQDERYVANPKNGSGHNKGISVDLTLIDLSTGTELDMGTAFDNFTDSAHHAFTNNFSKNIIENRKLLKTTMEQFGFKALETEWWHYAWISEEKYEVLDLSFKVLKKLVR